MSSSQIYLRLVDVDWLMLVLVCFMEVDDDFFTIFSFIGSRNLPRFLDMTTGAKASLSVCHFEQFEYCMYSQ